MWVYQKTLQHPVNIKNMDLNTSHVNVNHSRREQKKWN